jgi:hypothetical protein
MEQMNGSYKKVMDRNSRKANLGNRNRGSSCCIVFLALFLSACSLPKLKSSLITAGATSGAVLASSALIPSAIAPAIIGGGTAAIASALSAEPSVKGEPIAVTADTVVHKAPDNLWTLLQKLTEWGGIGLFIFIGATYLLPLILGYLIPNGFERKKKKR